jgi:hypothetical protein
MCFSAIQNKNRIFPQMSHTVAFSTAEAICFCEVGAEFLNVFQLNVDLKIVKS